MRTRRRTRSDSESRGREWLTENGSVTGLNNCVTVGISHSQVLSHLVIDWENLHRVREQMLLSLT